MDCKTARLLLDFNRPRARELPTDEAAELARHLSACPDCDAIGRTERRLDEHLGRAMRDVPVPDGLRQRLVERLRDERSSILRRRLAWTARAAAVAAALLVAALLGWHFFAGQPTKIRIYDAITSDYDKYNDRSPEAVESWFRDHHNISMAAPTQFNYGYLADYDMAELQGKSVPQLVFQRAENTGITRARVFVLSREQFDLSEMPTDPPEVESLGRRLTVWDSPERPETRYLVIYEGDSLQPLQIPAPEGH
jgi:hypothetical protein